MKKFNRKNKITLIIILSIFFIIGLILILFPGITKRLLGSIISFNENGNRSDIVLDTPLLIKDEKASIKIYNSSSESMEVNSLYFKINDEKYAQKDYLIERIIKSGNEKTFTLDSKNIPNEVLNSITNKIFYSKLNTCINYTIDYKDYELCSNSSLIRGFEENSMDTSETLHDGANEKQIVIKSKDGSIDDIIITMPRIIALSADEDLSSLNLKYSVTFNKDDNIQFYNPQSNKVRELYNKVLGNYDLGVFQNNFGIFNAWIEDEYITESNSFDLKGNSSYYGINDDILFNLYFTINNDYNNSSSNGNFYFENDELPLVNVRVYDKSELYNLITNGMMKLNYTYETSVVYDSFSEYFDRLIECINLYVNRYEYLDINNEYEIVDSYSIYMAYYSFLNQELLDTELSNYDSISNEVLLSNKINRNWYTDASLKKLDDLIENIEYDLPIDYQTKINYYANEIKLARDNLVLKDANWEEVYKIVNEAKGLRKKITIDKKEYDIYTEETLSLLNNTIDSIDYNKKINEQNIVDNYVILVNDAMNNLVKNDADYNELEELINEYNTNKLDNWYEPNASKDIDYYISKIDYNKKIDEQKVINNYYKELNDMMYKATIKYAYGVFKGDNYEPFKGALSIEEYYEILLSLNPEYYEAVSKERILRIQNNITRPFEEYIKEFKTDVYIYNQKDVDKYIKYFKEFIDTLVKKSGNYDELCKYYEEALGLDALYYENYETIMSVLWKLKWNYKIDEQDKIDAQTLELKTALDNLIKRKAYTELLERAYSKASILNPNYYKNFDKMQIALNKYPEIVKYPLMDQDKVDELTTEINYQLALLQLKDADYSKINYLKSIINQLDSSDYENYYLVTNALSAIEYGKKIDEQDKVNEMYNNLKNAYDSLIKKNVYVPDSKDIVIPKNETNIKLEELADYTELKYYANKIPSDTSEYNKELQNEVKDVIKDISKLPTNLPKSKQSTVDSLTNKIKDLLSRLKIDTKMEENISKDIKIKYIRVNGMDVDLNTTPYKYNLSDEINEAKVTVGLECDDCSYKTYGTENILPGENIITIEIKDKEKNIYNYKLILNKKDISNYLMELSIKDTSIDFDKNKNEYKININDKVTKLDIHAVPEDDTASVEIIGNKDLKDKDKINVIVTSSDGKSRNYILNVYKNKSYNSILIVIAITLVVAVILALSISKIKKHKKKK